MNTQKSKAIFIYFAPGKPDFWIFDGAAYHRFLKYDQQIHFIRSAKYLPANASGRAVSINWFTLRSLTQAAKRQRIIIQEFSSEEAAETAEMAKRHPAYVYGLSQPAGVLHFANTGYFFDD